MPKNDETTAGEKKGHIHSYKKGPGTILLTGKGKNRCGSCGELICGVSSPDEQYDCMLTDGHDGNHANKWYTSQTWR